MEKACTQCGKTKSLEDFHKKPGGLHGRVAKCKDCTSDLQKANRAKIRECERRWRRNNPEKAEQKRRRQLLRKHYGITLEDYDDLMDKQANGCAICGEPCKSGKYLAVDHDHETGEVRGLLCASHNVGLGMFGDDPVLLAAAIEYLKRAQK